MTAVGAALLLVGCTVSDATPNADADATPVPAVDLAGEISEVNKLIEAQSSDSLISASARPAILPAEHGDGARNTVLHDEDDIEWAAGRYLLTTMCAGEGSIVGTFSIGPDSEVSARTTCGSPAVVDYIELELPDASTGLSVDLVPADGTEAAIGYQITRR